MFSIEISFENIDPNWEEIQQVISTNNVYELIFTYSSNTTEYNYMAIDDISILDGICHLNRKKTKTF